MHSPQRPIPRSGPGTSSAATSSSTGRFSALPRGGPPSPGGPGNRRIASVTAPPGNSARAPPGSPGAPCRGSQTLNRQASEREGEGSPSMSRASSVGECQKVPSVDLFHIIQQLAAAENALWNILDGLKSNTTHASFFCREYWGCSCSQAQLSLEKLQLNDRVKRQVQMACVLESLSLGVAAHLCSGVMSNISVTIRSRLRNLLYYIHENCLVLLDMVCQRWMTEINDKGQENPSRGGHCPEKLNLDILVRVKRYRRLRRGEHVMALRQHNEMITNVVRQLCRGAAAAVPKSRAAMSGRMSPGDRSPGRGSPPGNAPVSVLSVVNDILNSRTSLDRQRATSIRAKMLSSMTFRSLLNVDGADPDSPWPTHDPYNRYGADTFAQDGCVIWFEPLPPMLPCLEQVPKLPPLANPDTYTLVLDLDETLVHYFEHDGLGNYDIRPGMHDFLTRMHQLGYEIVIFTAATQDYADWVIDQIDPTGLIHHRLYRQHALPWGPIFVKDMSKLGRNLDTTLMIDNVQENFMLQPNHGIFIYTWYDDPEDTALYALTPLLDELITTRSKVQDILEKYRDQIPAWAGFDISQLGGDFSEFDAASEEGGEVPPSAMGSYQPLEHHHEEVANPAQQQPYNAPAAQPCAQTSSPGSAQSALGSRFQQQPLPPAAAATRQAGYPQPGQGQQQQPQQQPQQQQQPKQQQPQQQQMQQQQQQQMQPQQQQQRQPQQQQSQQPQPQQYVPQQMQHMQMQMQPRQQAIQMQGPGPAGGPARPQVSAPAPAFSGVAGPYQASRAQPPAVG
ncbi:unnamed protein product, partial [Polarella glacialis]